MIVYPKVPYAYVYGDNNKIHKQGKVYPEQALEVIRRSGAWYLIEEPVLDRELEPGYPNFWIPIEDTVVSHGDPDAEPREREGCLIRILRFLLGLR